MKEVTYSGATFGGAPEGAIRAMLVSKVNPIAGVGPRLAPGPAPELGIR